MKITFGSDIVLGLQYGFSITDAASAPGPLADGIVTEDDVQIITEDGESVVIES